RSMRSILLVALSIAVLMPLPVANAEVSIAVGPTSIPRGDATGARDITVSNDFFAIAFAVETAPPWGVARGGIVDIAPVRDGKPGYDIASLADFMPNNWSSWPTTYQHVTIEKISSVAAVIKTTRDWGEVELETVFSIRDGDSKIHIVTRMTNNGDASLNGLLSGYVVWPDGGNLFGVPGLPVTTRNIAKGDALADWSAAYGEHWVLGLHAPFSDRVSRRGRDLYQLHDLQPGETKSFEAWLQIENDGTLAPLVQAEIDLQQLASGRISGRVVSNDGEPVSRPAVVVSKDDMPYAWTVGEDGDYDINLPAGNYDIYATARGYARGATKNVTVVKGSDTKMDFADIRPPGALQFKVADAKTKRALDARISIRHGYEPLIKYFGKNTFFTELDPMGETTVAIAPGNYIFEISAGGGFTSTPQLIEVVVESGKTHVLKTDIAVTAMPQEHGWYSADLHHHSDVLDGFTEAEYVLRSELAAGIDIAFLSDHDSVVNNNEMRTLSDTRGLHFIPGIELSPSWAHFNAYPLDDGKTVDIDTGQATVQEIFATARRMGADIVEVNHPYSGYGYFESLRQGMVPGGLDTSFDLVEIERIAYDERNRKTLKRVWQMWNEGRRVYLAGGSDVHDVWINESGSVRSYVHVDGDLSIEKFVAGLKAGHAFASQGPLVYPEILFGSEIHHSAGDRLALTFSVEAVSGLRSVQLIERGSEIEALSFDGVVKPVPVEFSVSPNADTWYSLVIEDMNGRFAYTNPVWVMIAK
ncbi:MAG: CehA/McbA family metallohydrolase, partial [Proteobacteria bacterium]|nr:CehA/McbA family metallohydrolase [Pseudomonadota bacterium]